MIIVSSIAHLFSLFTKCSLKIHYFNFVSCKHHATTKEKASNLSWLLVKVSIPFYCLGIYCYSYIYRLPFFSVHVARHSKKYFRFVSWYPHGSVMGINHNKHLLLFNYEGEGSSLLFGRLLSCHLYVLPFSFFSWCSAKFKLFPLHSQDNLVFGAFLLRWCVRVWSGFFRLFVALSAYK
jgi:hypothetical protein